ETPVLAQAADLIGITGLAFLPVLMSAVIVQTTARFKQEAAAGKLKPRLDFSVAALLLALQFCYGVWRINQVNGMDTQRVRILLVQGNIAQDIKWDPASVTDILETYADTTSEAIDTLEQDNLAQVEANVNGDAVELKQPDLVIWPESAIPTPLYFADKLDGYLLFAEMHHLINEEIRPLHAILGPFALISGMNEFESDFNGERAVWKEGGKQFNSIAIIAPQGELEKSISTWRKMHLVIFGEYIPLIDKLPFLGELFKFSVGADFAGNFDAGTSTEPMVAPVGDSQVQLIPSVCFEDTVGRLTRKFVRPEPQLIINVTNDGWFKHSEAAEQHIANAKFRAIELRRPMVRSANTGVSAIISITGSLVDPATGKRQVIEDEHGSHFVRGSIYGHAYAPTHGPLTLYALAGDWFAYVMMGMIALFALNSKLTKD
ncbi:MAG: apolipoprotein N-acyltransferase, partial [Akkermansiaceae bacterium]